MCSRRDKSLDSDPSALSVVRQVNVPNVMFCWPWLPLVVETNVTLFFCQIQSNVTPCNSLYTKTPSPLTHMTSRPSLLYTHQCLRKESFCVLSLSFVYVLCCTSQPFCHRCTHKHTHTKRHTSATEPLNFSSVTHSFFFFFVSSWQTRICAERPRLLFIATQDASAESLWVVLFICFKAAFII